MITRSKGNAAAATSVAGDNLQAQTRSKSNVSNLSSKSVLIAQRRALEAQHARRLADLAAEEQRERERVLAVERAAAEAELRAQLADLDAQASARSSRSPSHASSRGTAAVEAWLEATSAEAEAAEPLPAAKVNGAGLSPPFTTFTARHTAQAQFGLPGVQPIASTSQELPPGPQISRTAAVQAPHLQTHSLGTQKPTNCNINNISSEVQHLTQALREALTPKRRIGELPLPIYSGAPSDWPKFHKMYLRTKKEFNNLENLTRLSVALKGFALEAATSLLATADDPDVVIAALQQQFGVPEVVVMKVIAEVRALPRVSGYDAQELNVFACKVRNCISTVQLLQQHSHLANPELCNSILGKLSPLLREKWLEFACQFEHDSRFRLEKLSDFLSREASLHLKFGLLTDSKSRTDKSHAVFVDQADSTSSTLSPPAPSQISSSVCHATSSGVTSHRVGKASSSFSSPPGRCKDEPECLFCKASHDVRKCQQFLDLVVDKRLSWAKESGICFKCLRKGGHSYKDCKKFCKVKGCKNKHRHHSLLHEAATANVNFALDSSSSAVLEEASTKSNTNCNQSEADALAHVFSLGQTVSQDCPRGVPRDVRPLLKILPVTISGPIGSIDTFALLDEGSTATFIDAKVSSAIGATGPKKTVIISCVRSLAKQVEVEYVNFTIKGRDETCQPHVIKQARSVSDLGLSRQSLSRCDTNLKHLEGLKLCNYLDVEPSLLIGIDNWHLLIASEVRRASRSQPVACRTPLGWVVYGFPTSRTSVVNISGSSPSHERSTYVNHLKDHTLEELIRNNYNLESIGIDKKERLGTDDNFAIETLKTKTRRLSSGRFETGLLWRPDVDFDQLPNSYALARRRFTSLEQKMIRDPEYAAAYRSNVQATIDKGYAEKCEVPHAATTVKWYLPHFGVIHPQKKKLRVVHDCAAQAQGVSLNSLLLSGPDLLQPLLEVLMRFREGLVALNADIREMYPQIKIREADRDAQRFLWRADPSQPLCHYRMSSMVFGATSSPFTALYLKNLNAEQHKECFPKAANAIINDHYMDDLVTAVDEVSKAAQLARDIVDVHSRAGFEMRSWVSNKAGALSLVPEDLRASEASDKVKILGVVWNPVRDILQPTRNLNVDDSSTFTKRFVLSRLMSVYDPLGLLSPVTVKGKILFQKTWRVVSDWDAELPQDVAAQWREWFGDLGRVAHCSLPRCYYDNPAFSNVELHVFADASELAYACVAYWRFLYPDGTVKVSVIAGKTRCAPLKHASIPRLELQAALIAARLGMFIANCHRRQPSKLFFWTDSLTVLKWLRSDVRSLKAFVAHRVGEIAEITSVSDWRYVNSAQNVADDATRPNNKFEISRWLSGPSFLASNSGWPEEPQVSFPLPEVINCASETLQEKPSVVPVVADYTRFSSWLRLLRATARIYFCANVFLKRPIQLAGHLSAEDIMKAEHQLLLQSQLDSFADEMTSCKNATPLSQTSRLKNVSLVIRDDHLLRLSSRVVTTEVLQPGHEQEPIILDGRHPVVQLLIHYYHRREAHGGVEAIVNALRIRFYVLRLRPSVKAAVSKCNLCRIRRAQVTTPPFGNLPPARVASYSRPFSHVGVDYFGPVTVAQGRRHLKRYVALFTCLTVRAVHLEVVESLLSDSAVMAIRRLIARRGCPEAIYSDNGTAFVGAARMLPVLYDFSANKKIRWIFIPPAAPFMGGCWERLVRSVKRSLSVILKERAPKEEVLYTLLLEVESIINSRPLTHVPVEPGEPEALTPFHFILGGPINDLPLAPLSDSELFGRLCYKKGLRLADHFWQRWTREYLPTLFPRKSGQARQFGVGDLVLVVDGSLPRGSWPRGRIAKVYPGRDGVVRVVDVATAAGLYKRATRLLVHLDITCSPS